MTRAPASRAVRIVGSAARMRRSLVMWPLSSSGTLKSTRMRTRLPRRLPRSSIVFLAMIVDSVNTGLTRRRGVKTPSLARRAQISTLADHVAQQIDATVGVAPLVVIPANELEETIVQLDAGAGV